jgi:uncharacterized membrane protein
VFFVVMLIFLEIFLFDILLCLLVVAVEVCGPHSGQSVSPGGGNLQPEQNSCGEAACTRKAQQKKREIAKRDRNDNRVKRRKAGERGVSSNEDPSPSWSGDVASTAVDWSDMSGSSSSSPTRATEVSSSRRP